jgi:hypothetical protein
MAMVIKYSQYGKLFVVELIGGIGGKMGDAHYFYSFEEIG